MAKLLFDPQQLPIDAIAGEPAVPAERLAPDWLRARFAAPPLWTPEGDETPFAPQASAKAAAVLVPLVQRAEGLRLLLTQRTDHLSSHAGQISFPGGRAEEYDASPADTALREAEEEIGLDRRHAEIIGTLPVYYTGTNYSVTPVVALLHPPFELRADPGEVAEIFEVPLAFLMDGLNHQRLSAELASGRRSFYAMPYQRYYIWGATAGMLRNLFHFLRA
ncbi:DNA mismatch repair protein MutT [Massilia sp. Root351]|uniref:CoA pyrophosphatase n=1 Tax=Massilia sp. Root351 TaxID=1736522 RepID=UPI0007110940|nr:CoA pyrophosphatase [Massilia sp. Root351]KQV78640.1 DNA mismatch repair protein MutT [Massilia sp. Root351]